MNENGKAGPHSPFDEEINVRVIYMVAGILVAVTLAVYLMVSGLLRHYETRDVAVGQTQNPLLKADNERNLQQRVESIPGPHLEGLEQEDNRVLLKTSSGEEWYYVPASAFIEKDGKHKKEGDKPWQLYDLRVGTMVKLSYWDRDERHVVTTLITPVPQSKENPSESATHIVIGRILKIEPQSIHGWQQWAAARKSRYGWTDSNSQIAHIPLEAAMQQVLRTEEFQDAGKGKEPPAWLDRPTSSSSGRSTKEKE